MKVSQINFTGLKNTGYCWVRDKLNDQELIRMSLNTELTGKDKNDYYKIMRNYPGYENEIATNFLNIELLSGIQNDSLIIYLKLNGVPVSFVKDNYEILKYLNGVVNKIKNKDSNDFVVNKSYIESSACRYGLIYGNDFDEYIDGTYGTIGLFGGKRFPHSYNNKIMEIMHDSFIVKGGANFISKIISNVNNSIRGN